MDLDQKLKTQLGELVFMVTVLQHQLEQANAEIAELKKEKDETKL